ncbi:MAG: NAD(P)-dependent oxidoreductase [Actinomycetota bacterium]
MKSGRSDDGAGDGMRVAVLGLGAMGSRIAHRIAQSGHEVAVWNRTASVAVELVEESSGAFRASESARGAVVGADVVIAMVADDEASRSVWLGDGHGVLAALPAGCVAIDASTITPAAARSLAARVGEVGVAFLEAPVVGSRPQADAGALVSLVGGDATALDRARSVVTAYSGAIRHLGAVGTAATMKLAINGLFATQVALFSEIAALLERSDVDTGEAYEVLAGLPITAPAVQRILGLVEDRDFAPNFPVSLVEKDLRYLGALGRSIESELPLATAAHGAFAAAVAAGRGELDIAGVAANYVETSESR